jgi:class 3 adenylate cyclase/pimeloyl-ACP methyl ester carboxylesterase
VPPRTDYATLDGREVAYQVFGDGEDALVYVWGTMSHLDWYWSDPDLTHALRRNAARARVLMYDHAGVGMSDPTPRPPSIEERAAELAALIDHVGFHRPHLVGVVDGCATAAYLAATQPDKIGRLQLLSPWLTGPGPHPWSLPQATYEQWLDVVANWGEGRSLDLLFPSMTRSPFHRRLWGTFERSAMSRGTARQFAEAYLHIDVSPLLSQIRTPTIVMANRGDPVIPAAGARALAAEIPNSTFVELDGSDVGFAYNTDLDDAIDRSLEFLIGAGPAVDADRAYLTVMFTDIVSSTSTLAAIGDSAWLELLRQAVHRHREAIGRHGGDEVGQRGDGLVATFPSPGAAVLAGEALVSDLAGLGLGLRVGLHTGEVRLIGEDPTGMTMHFAARVCSAADGGQVLVSEATANLLDSAAFGTSPAGTHALKGVPGRHQLFTAEVIERPDLPLPRRELTLYDRMVGQAVRRAPGMSRALIQLSRRAS